VPRRLVADNVKAAVKELLVHDQVLAEAYRRVAQQYRFAIRPTRPATPKGKVESGVHHFQRKLMAGQSSANAGVANQRALVRVREVAGTRIHGTTHETPLKLFNDLEQTALLPLSGEPFTLCEIRQAKVHPDCRANLSAATTMPVGAVIRPLGARKLFAMARCICAPCRGQGDGRRRGALAFSCLALPTLRPSRAARVWRI